MSRLFSVSSCRLFLDIDVSILCPAFSRPPLAHLHHRQGRLSSLRRFTPFIALLRHRHLVRYHLAWCFYAPFISRLVFPRTVSLVWCFYTPFISPGVSTHRIS